MQAYKRSSDAARRRLSAPHEHSSALPLNTTARRPAHRLVFGLFFCYFGLLSSRFRQISGGFSRKVRCFRPKVSRFLCRTAGLPVFLVTYDRPGAHQQIDHGEGQYLVGDAAEVAPRMKTVRTASMK